MIGGDMLASLAGIGGALVLVIAALWRRRMGRRSLALLALAWIGIIGLLWAIASFGPRFGHTHFT